MVELRKIETGPGLVFDVSIAGDAAAPLVLLLHGFAVSRHLYDAQLPALARAGFFAVAPDQRGYSAGARPDPADVARYDIELLVEDALDIAAAVGHGARPFHLVGHDWGGSLAWEIAARHPERLGSLTMLSRPHPDAFGRALREDPEQPRRSRHHKAFLDPGAAAGLLADDADLDLVYRTQTAVISGVITQQLANAPGEPFETGTFTSTLPDVVSMWLAHHGGPRIHPPD